MGRGRNKQEYDTEIIMGIINKYLEEMANPFLKIEYRPIYEFACKLYNSGQLDDSITEELSIYYWRTKDRQGRVLVDEVNRLNLLQTNNFKETEFTMVSTKSIVEQYSFDKPAIKKKLVAQLLINEKGYSSLQEKYKGQKKKIETFESENKMLNDQIRILKEQNNILVKVMMQWANISSSRDIEIVNTITTGKTRTKVVEQLFEEMFTEDPHRAYKDINFSPPKTSNITKLDSTRKNTILDDYDL
ncbi:hypothetical protein [Ureibacillus chungkukjangi]|uniref:hypothetical protein n=1 Tax=Ureibacillus chungkukjangi TaxID=1202712 RepID=UPI000D362409|nr:hypothetical protein [Ureibacillus chungkukjangi]